MSIQTNVIHFPFSQTCTIFQTFTTSGKLVCRLPCFFRIPDKIFYQNKLGTVYDRKAWWLRVKKHKQLSKNLCCIKTVINIVVALYRVLLVGVVILPLPQDRNSLFIIHFLFPNPASSAGDNLVYNSQMHTRLHYLTGPSLARTWCGTS